MAHSKIQKLDYKVLLVLSVGLLAGIISGVFYLKNSSDSYKTPIYSQNETIKQPKFEIKLNESNIMQYEEPNSGMSFSYVIVNISITNTSNDTLSFIPVFQSHIRTAKGKSLDMSPYPDLKNPINAGDIEPGVTLTGELSYLVSNTDQQLLFYFGPDWSEEPVFIRL